MNDKSDDRVVNRVRYEMSALLCV